MKVRNGFVSNSSSSSFIVSGKLEDLTQARINIPVNITKYGEVIKTINELNDYICDNYGGRDETVEEIVEGECLTERYNTAAAAINRGEVVCWGSCSDDTGDPVECMLSSHGFEGIFDNINILSSGN